MAYRLTLDDDGVGAGFRRITAEQVDLALAALDLAETNLERGVHGVRTASKRTRALIRLVRPVFPDHAEANAAFRALAGDLGALRETQVMLATFDGLDGVTGKGGKSLAALRLDLLAAETAAIEHVQQAALLAETRARLLTLRAALQGWELERDGFGALRKGLLRTCRKAWKAMAEAAEGDTEAFHEWRKHIKDHGFHVRLLHDIDPGLAARGEMLGRLGDLLGEQHDLCVLEARIAGGKGKALRKLGDAAAKRRAALEAEALRLGAVLFEEPCKARVRRWEKAWDAWREGA